MRPRCSVFIATSLDGYISRPDGAIDWLPADGTVEDHGYDAFMSTIDAIVLGRHTYELVCSFGGWHYGDRRVVVLSSGTVTVPPGHARYVTVLPGPPSTALQYLADTGCRHIYVDGGLTIQAFLAAGLIDDLTITTIPVLLGAGRRLFGALGADVHLEHQSTQSYASGLVQSVWRVGRVGRADG